MDRNPNKYLCSLPYMRNIPLAFTHKLVNKYMADLEAHAPSDTQGPSMSPGGKKSVTMQAIRMMEPWDPCMQTRAGRIPFGRLAIPILKRQLSAQNSLKVFETLEILSQILHEPEQAAVAIKYNIAAPFRRLLLHSKKLIRMGTLKCMLTINGATGGQKDLIKRKNLIDTLMTVMRNNDSDERQLAVITYQRILFNKGVALLDGSSSEKTVKMCSGGVQEEKSEVEILICLIQLLTIMTEDMTEYRLMSIVHDAFDMRDLLVHEDERLREATANLFTQIFKEPIGRIGAYQHGFLPILCEECLEGPTSKRVAMMRTLSYASLTSEAKIQCVELKMYEKILKILVCERDPSLIHLHTLCIVVLQNLAETSIARAFLLANMHYIRPFETHPKFCELTKELIKIIEWEP